VFVVPAFNEAATITRVVSLLLPLGDIFVVDDCSSDETGSVALNAGATLILRCEQNRGYDGALDCGFKAAFAKGYSYFVTCDADGQHPISAIENACKILTSDSGIQLVMGVRKSFQRPAEAIFSIFTRLFYGISDPLSGLKGYSRRALGTNGAFGSYPSVGTELALRVAKHKRKFREFSFDVLPRLDKPRFGSRFKANFRIILAMVRWFSWYQFKK